MVVVVVVVVVVVQRQELGTLDVENSDLNLVCSLYIAPVYSAV